MADQAHINTYKPRLKKNRNTAGTAVEGQEGEAHQSMGIQWLQGFFKEQTA